MDESIYLLEPVLDAEKLDKKFMLLLQACEEQQAFAFKAPNKIQSVVATINRRLNSSASRKAGLLLLKTFLPQCTDETFLDNVISWMNQCVKGLMKNNREGVEEDAYETLSVMFRMSAKLLELNKPISQTIIPKFLENISHAQNMTAALKCLEVVLLNYGASCKSNKNNLEELLLHCMDEDDSAVLEYAGRCMSVLPLVGSGGAGGSNFRLAWTRQHLQLCAAANLALDELLSCTDELPQPAVLSKLVQDEDEQLLLPPLEQEDPLLRALALRMRLSNLLGFLTHMLQGQLPVEKSVRVDILMALACRGLAVSTKSVASSGSIEAVALAAVLPQVHIALLRLLETAVLCCGGAMIRYGPLVCRLVLQTLKWTAAPSWASGIERPYIGVRVAAYALLEAWAVRTRAGSCVELLADQLVPLLLADVNDIAPPVTLQVQQVSRKHLTKQQRRSLGQQQQQQSKPTGPEAGQAPESCRVRVADVRANAALCEASLRALSAMVRAAGPLLKPARHEEMLQRVVALCLAIHRATGPANLPAPYSTAACRLQLYRLLSALAQHWNPRGPPPPQQAAAIFAAAEQDPALEVAAFCAEALRCTLQGLHPARSALQPPRTPRAPAKSLTAEETALTSTSPSPESEPPSESPLTQRSQSLLDLPPRSGPSTCDDSGSPHSVETHILERSPSPELNAPASAPAPAPATAPAPDPGTAPASSPPPGAAQTDSSPIADTKEHSEEVAGVIPCSGSESSEIPLTQMSARSNSPPLTISQSPKSSPCKDSSSSQSPRHPESQSQERGEKRGPGALDLGDYVAPKRPREEDTAAAFSSMGSDREKTSSPTLDLTLSDDEEEEGHAGQGARRGGGPEDAGSESGSEMLLRWEPEEHSSAGPTSTAGGASASVREKATTPPQPRDMEEASADLAAVGNSPLVEDEPAAKKVRFEEEVMEKEKDDMNAAAAADDDDICITFVDIVGPQVNDEA